MVMLRAHLMTYLFSLSRFHLFAKTVGKLALTFLVPRYFQLTIHNNSPNR